MAEFVQKPKYNYFWQNAKFANISYSGSDISQFINNKGYLTSADITSSGGVPSGSDSQIQYNNEGSFGGVPVLTYDKITLRATGSFSGSLVGIASTASYAVLAQTASYIDGGEF
jgi:hypothetical protein